MPNDTIRSFMEFQFNFSQKTPEFNDTDWYNANRPNCINAAVNYFQDEINSQADSIADNGQFNQPGNKVI